MSEAVVSAAASAWDERYAASDLVWTAEPNRLAASLIVDLPAGRALDVAAGEGRMALWLASRGWHVQAPDGRQPDLLTTGMPRPCLRQRPRRRSSNDFLGAAVQAHRCAAGTLARTASTC